MQPRGIDLTVLTERVLPSGDDERRRKRAEIRGTERRGVGFLAVLRPRRVVAAVLPGVVRRLRPGRGRCWRLRSPAVPVVGSWRPLRSVSGGLPSGLGPVGRVGTRLGRWFRDVAGRSAGGRRRVASRCVCPVVVIARLGSRRLGSSCGLVGVVGRLVLGCGGIADPGAVRVARLSSGGRHVPHAGALVRHARSGVSFGGSYPFS